MPLATSVTASRPSIRPMYPRPPKSPRMRGGSDSSAKKPASDANPVTL